MMDWFASKIGMLAFIAVSLSLLMAFSGMQLSLLDMSKKVSSANDVARLADCLCEGCSAYYEFERNYTLAIGRNSVGIEGTVRQTLANLTEGGMDVKAVTLRKQGGEVTLYGA